MALEHLQIEPERVACRDRLDWDIEGGRRAGGNAGGPDSFFCGPFA